jgi:selenocysteine-specific translation elongation factor
MRAFLFGRETPPRSLAEERRRGLTLDLGFAWCDLPSGRRAAFVDRAYEDALFWMRQSP